MRAMALAPAHGCLGGGTGECAFCSEVGFSGFSVLLWLGVGGVYVRAGVRRARALEGIHSMASGHLGSVDGPCELCHA